MDGQCKPKPHRRRSLPGGLPFLTTRFKKADDCPTIASRFPALRSREERGCGREGKGKRQRCAEPSMEVINQYSSRCPGFLRAVCCLAVVGRRSGVCGGSSSSSSGGVGLRWARSQCQSQRQCRWPLVRRTVPASSEYRFAHLGDDPNLVFSRLLSF